MSNISTDFTKTTFGARMDSAPPVECLRQGIFTTKEEVYAEAARNARAARPLANTEHCSGSPGRIYPYVSEVLGEDLLARTCLSTIFEDGDSSVRSPLPVQSSRAERKVAQNFFPRDISTDISREAEDVSKPTAASASLSAAGSVSPGPRSPPRKPVPRKSTRDAKATDPLVAPRADETPSRVPGSGGEHISGFSPLPQAGAKAVLDATAAYRHGNQLLAYHEQYIKVFPLSCRLATGRKRPELWLNEVDPIVGTAIAAAIDGQVSLLHVVRETLLGIPGDRARELSRQLSKSQIDYTGARWLRTHDESAETMLDVALGIFPFGRMALDLIADLLVTGSLAHDKALLAAVGRATIDGGPGRIVVDIGDLIDAVSQAGDADVDPTDAVVALESLIAKNGRIVFTAPSPDDSSINIDWQNFAVQTSRVNTDRRRRNRRASMHDLNTLMDSLQDFSMASATVSDLLASAIGADAAPPHSAYQLDGANRTAASVANAAVFQLDNNIDGGDADDLLDRFIFYTSSFESTAPCRYCKKDNPSRSMMCRHCRKFVAAVWQCAVCKLPTPFSEENCHQWMCTGTQPKKKETVSPQEALAWETLYTKRLESARQQSKREGGDRGGGKGGAGGKGGRGASE